MRATHTYTLERRMEYIERSKAHDSFSVKADKRPNRHHTGKSKGNNVETIIPCFHSKFWTAHTNKVYCLKHSIL